MSLNIILQACLCCSSGTLSAKLSTAGLFLLHLKSLIIPDHRSILSIRDSPSSCRSFQYRQSSKTIVYTLHEIIQRLKMWSILPALLFLAQPVWCVSQCNPYTGPSGSTECIRIITYHNQYQWATCLTNTYIKQKSGHRHACVNPLATYCWYQCMVEVYSLNSGPVTSSCSCTPRRKLTSSLPQFCYSPSGDSCNWYGDCIGRYYPSCKDTNNAYAIRYAKKFCEVFKRKALFSSEGQKWVDAARRCLQVNLVPLVRPWIKATCYQIRRWSLASHAHCYLMPDQNVSSICNVTCTDYFKIFWAIKGSFLKLDTAWQSMKGLWNIETSCGVNSKIHQCFQEEAGGMMKFTKITVQKFRQREYQSSDRSLPVADAGSRFADAVGSAIVQTMKWNTLVMDWVAYISGSYGGSDNVDIIIVFVDSKALGIVTTSTPSINFNHTIQEFASAIKEDKLPLQVDGYIVWVKSLALCSEKSCNNTQTLAVSEKPPILKTTPKLQPNPKLNTDAPKLVGAARMSHGTLGLLGFTTVLIMFINKLFF